MSERIISSFISLSSSNKKLSWSKSQKQDSTLDPNLKKIADNLENVGEDDDGSKDVLELVRLKVKNFMFHSYIGKLYNLAMLFLSIVSCLEFIFTTYLDLNKPDDENLNNLLKIAELFVACLFAFDWLLSFFIADQKFLFLSSFYSMVDLMTVIPIFTTYNEHCTAYINNLYTYTFQEVLFYILCGLNTTRILRALRVHRIVDNIEDDVQQCLAHMVVNVVVMILFNSSVMQYLENHQNYSFHTWMYFMTVTIASVGYGDITAQTDIGRFADIGMIIFAIITVPQMTNELIDKMSRQSIYARVRYIPKSMNAQHVVVGGNLVSASLNEFFEELFHPDHEIRGLHCVVLQPSLPSPEMKLILKDPKFQGLITYLEGFPLIDNDLKRADVVNARAIFIMANKFAANPDEEDAKTILEQFSIQKYIRLNSLQSNSQPLFCLQLIRPENKRHLVTIDRDPFSQHKQEFNQNHHHPVGNHHHKHHSSEQDVVVCLNEIKMGVIAKAVMFPGVNTLIMNLLTSFTDDVTPTNNSIKPMEGIETLEEDEHGSDWLGEYQRGCDWEIYTTELSTTFEGTTFCALADMLYHKLGIVLFGLEIEELKKDKPVKKIYLNPADFIIPKSDEFRILAIVIAKNKAQSDLTFSKVSDQDSIFNSGMTFSHLSLLTNSLTNQASNVTNMDTMLTQDPFEKKLLNKMDQHQRGLLLSPNLNNNLSEGNLHNSSPGNNNNNNSNNPGGVSDHFKQKLEWQLLLRKYDQEKTTETIQEELQKLEDKYLTQNYFVRSMDHLIELQDAYVRTSVTEELPFIENHIIIIGKSLSNLYDLIRPLRAKSLGVLKHIIILYPADFPIRLWQRISIFESIWIVRGSPLEENDLRRCGIFKAKQIVLLSSGGGIGGGGLDGNNVSTGGNAKNSNNPSNGGNAVAGMSALDDVDAIFCYQAIKRMNESAHIVVEIVRHTNVGYLDPESGLNSSDVDYKFTPQFASGTLFTTSMLDTVVCQSFFNTKIVDILNKLVGGTSSDKKDHIDATANHLFFGHQQQSKSKSNLLAKGLINSSLYQIPLPEKLESRTYGALFSLLARKKQIPLGLLRGVFANTKSGPKNNTTPYVFTNPPKDTELFSCDKVFVLSQKPIKITRVAKDESKETHFYSTIRSKRKTAEDVLNVVHAVKEDLFINQQRNHHLELKIHSLMDEFQENMKKLRNGMESIHSNYLQGQHQMNKSSNPQSRRNTGASRTNSDDHIEYDPSLNLSNHGNPSGFVRSRGVSRVRTSSGDSLFGSPGGNNNNNNNNNANRPRSVSRARTSSAGEGLLSPSSPKLSRSPSTPSMRKSRARPQSAQSQNSVRSTPSPQRLSRKYYNPNSSV